MKIVRLTFNYISVTFICQYFTVNCYWELPFSNGYSDLIWQNMTVFNTEYYLHSDLYSENLSLQRNGYPYCHPSYNLTVHDCKLMSSSFLNTLATYAAPLISQEGNLFILILLLILILHCIQIRSHNLIYQTKCTLLRQLFLMLGKRAPDGRLSLIYNTKLYLLAIQSVQHTPVSRSQTCLPPDMNRTFIFTIDIHVYSD